MNATSSLPIPLPRLVVALLFSAMTGFASGCAHVAAHTRAPSVGSSLEVDRVDALGAIAAPFDAERLLEPAWQRRAVQMTADANALLSRVRAAEMPSPPANAPALEDVAMLDAHREIRRLARLGRAVPLRDDIAGFHAYLACHGEVLVALDGDPMLVADAAFLCAHPDLADFLDHHPSLSTVLFERAERRRARLGEAT